MRQLHVSTFASLDGMHSADGSFAFSYPYQDEEFARYSDEFLRNYDTMVAGRVTYEIFKKYQTSDEAIPSEDTLHSHQLVVFSNTLADEDLGDTIRYRGDLVVNMKALKEQPGKDILCIGGSGLRSQLLNAGLVDRVKIWYVPIALGSGKPVFEGVDKPINLKLMRSYTFHNGLIRLEYDVLDANH